MIARVIVQTNKDGERHVTFTTDLITDKSEYLIGSRGWEDAEVISGCVLILSSDSSDDHVAALMDEELHTATSSHPEVVINKALERLLNHVQ